MKRLFGLIVILMLWVPLGCETSEELVVEQIKPVMLGMSAEAYDGFFNRTRDTLLELGFEIDRQDQRFGVITTEPKTSSTIFEPWDQNSVTQRDAFYATLNMQRRVVRVNLIAQKDMKQAPDSFELILIDVNPDGVAYYADIQVMVLQRQHPTPELNTAAIASPSFRNRERGLVRTQLTEAGMDESYWRELGRDLAYERMVAQRISGKSMERGAITE